MSSLPEKMYIDGCWVSAVSGEVRKIINPFNREVIAEVAEGSRADSVLALEAARKAFDCGEWRGWSAAERGNILFRLAGKIDDEREELARLETLDTGKTLEESRWDMADIAEIFRYYAGLADKDGGEVIAIPQNAAQTEASSIVLREPVGVCGQISPWNYPLLQAAWKLAPALAAGCTVVIKPSEITPLSTLKLTAMMAELDFPAGVINTVLGAGAEVGAELAESSLADLISFTGGIATGKSIMQAASRNVKKVALELGGKNPNIIFADADLDTALDYALNAVFFHAGQICSAGSRLMLEESIHDDFVAALKERIARIRLGDGMQPATEMGPLISEQHRDKVERLIALAIKEGAVLECGGGRPDDAALQKGFFLEPTLFTGCHGGMDIIQEEIFGPVITVEKFADEEEAAALANNTIYGLSAGFWTKDAARIHRLSRKLRFGTVWVNDFNVYFSQAPWGGYKQSGLGRELGAVGFEEYTEVKHIYQNYNPQKIEWFGTGKSAQ